jgi:hypothetical protein
VACHTNILRMLQVHTKTPQQWRDTVYSMISRGAQVMPGEIEPVTAFLAANAGSNRLAITQTSRGYRDREERTNRRRKLRAEPYFNGLASNAMT